MNISPLELELRQHPGNGLLFVAEIKRPRCVVEQFDVWSVANYTHSFWEWNRSPRENRRFRARTRISKRHLPRASSRR
jgi:hypothetical protein